MQLSLCCDILETDGQIGINRAGSARGHARDWQLDKCCYTIGYRPVRDCGGQIGICRADARMDNVQLTIENCGISFGNHLKPSL